MVMVVMMRSCVRKGGRGSKNGFDLATNDWQGPKMDEIFISF